MNRYCSFIKFKVQKSNLLLFQINRLNNLIQINIYEILIDIFQ